MSSSTLIKSFSFPSALKMDQQETDHKKQGIVSILGFDTEKEAKSTASLRRTISADMSSRKWLKQNSLASPIKKVASSKDFQKVCMEDADQPPFGDQHDLERPDQSEVWNIIQEANKKKEIDIKKQTTFDWTCILAQKDDSSKDSSPPYVHPLVNRTASSLSEKSLEVCTESLGSETGSEQTGSDGFSYPPSRTEDGKEQEIKEVQDHQQEKQEKVSPTFDKEDFTNVKLHYADKKKIQPRSFPPPLPSLSHGCNNSSSLQMRPRRDNGRLVLEAVTVPSQNTFHAQRQDGRLVLSLADTSSYEEENSMNQEKTNDEELKDAKEFEEIFSDFEEDEGGVDFDSDEEDNEEGDDEEEAKMEKDGNVKDGQEKNMEYVMDTTLPKYSHGMKNVHGLLLMANKPMALVRRTPTWTNKLNEEVKPQGIINEENITVAKSLPPRPPTSRLMFSKPKLSATATLTEASLNAYEKLHIQEMTSPSLEEKFNNRLIVSKNLVANEQQQLQLLRGSSADRLVPVIKGCKESRRSLLFLEPHCIATS